jgi:hypothetical protein
MSVFRALLVPLAGLLIGLGLLISGQVGRAFIIAGTVLFGVAVVLVPLGA